MNRNDLLASSAQRRASQAEADRCEQLSQAALPKRIAAAVIDFGIVSCAILAIVELLRLTGVNCSAFVYWLICYIIFLFRDITGGRSPGKRIAGLDVVYTWDETKHASIPDMLRRSLPDIILPLSIYQLCTGRQKTGDRWARTRVIARPVSASRTAAVWLCAVVCAAAILGAHSIAGQSWLMHTDAYAAAVEYLEENGYAGDASVYSVSAGTVLGDNAGMDITVDGARYRLVIENIDGSWTVVSCKEFN